MEQMEVVKENQPNSNITRTEMQVISDTSSYEKDKAFYEFLEKAHSPEDIRTRRYLAFCLIGIIVLLGAFISFAFYVQSIKGTTIDKTINGLLVNYSYFIMFLTVTAFGFYYGVRTSNEIVGALLPSKQEDVKKNLKS